MTSRGRSPFRLPEPEPLLGPFGRPALPLGRLFRIEIGLDSSWIIIFALVTFSLTERFAGQHAQWSWGLALLVGVATSLLFFGSLLLHELGHSLTSEALGLPIRSITLFIFGGMARLTREPERPRDEFLIAVAGPLVSFALALAFAGLMAVTAGESFLAEATEASFTTLMEVNLALAIFNCVPGFPLDGGRVLRAIAWALTGSFERATRWAAAAGAGFAYLLIFLGVFLAVGMRQFVSGLWLVLIGWFLLRAARSGVAYLVLKRALEGLRVGEIYGGEGLRVSGEMTVAELIEGPVVRQGLRTFYVESADGRVGYLTLRDLRRVAPADRATTPLEAVAVSADALPRVNPEETLWGTLLRMEEAGQGQVAVVDNNVLLGILPREALQQVARRRLEVG